jgi:hypothetical protein
MLVNRPDVDHLHAHWFHSLLTRQPYSQGIPHFLVILMLRWQAVFDAVGQCPVVPPTSTSARREGAHNLKDILPLAAALNQLEIPAPAEQPSSSQAGSQSEDEMQWVTQDNQQVEHSLGAAKYPRHLVLHEPLPRWPASLGATVTAANTQR